MASALKSSITTAADDTHKYSEKIRLAGQRIHLKHQAIFSTKEKSKKKKKKKNTKVTSAAIFVWRFKG